MEPQGPNFLCSLNNSVAGERNSINRQVRREQKRWEVNMKRVLLVVDDSHLIESLQRGLEDEDYSIFSAVSEDEGLQIVRDEKIDLVVSDQNMPCTDGIKFLFQVKQARPGTVCFMLTENEALDLAAQAVNAGSINRFFTKPCNTVNLAVSIRHALEYKELVMYSKTLLKKTLRYEAILDQIETEYSVNTTIDLDERAADEVQDGYDSLITILREAESPAKQEDVDIGARVLKVAIAFERQIRHGLSSGDVISRMLELPGIYNPQVVETLTSLVESEDPSPDEITTKHISIADLKVGMITDADIFSSDGVLLISKGFEITDPILACLLNVANGVGVEEPFKVQVLS